MVEPGFQLMADEEIYSHVTSGEPSDNESEAEEAEAQPTYTCPVSNSQAAHMSEKCLTWLEHQPEANQYNVCDEANNPNTVAIVVHSCYSDTQCTCIHRQTDTRTHCMHSYRSSEV